MESNLEHPAKPGTVEAILLDVDGTLIDSNDAHADAWTEVLAIFGHRVDRAAVRQQMGKGGDQLMPVFLSKEQVERAGKEIENRRKQIFKEKYLPRLRAFPGTREFVQRALAGGKKVVLASSAAGEELEVYKRLARIDDLIQSATSRDDAARSKPHPDIFEAALEEAGGISPARAIVIGDAPYDAQAATKASVRCIGLLSGGFTEGQLRHSGAVAIYRDVADLLAQYDTSLLAV